MAIGGFFVGAVIVFGLLGAIALLALQHGPMIIRNTRYRDSLNEGLNNLADFTVSEKFISSEPKTAIAVDTERHKVAVVEVASSPWMPNEAPHATPKVYIYDFSELLEFAVTEDGNAVKHVSRGSQAGGALIGGALLGGVGAIIGGLSGSTTSTQKVKSIDLWLAARGDSTQIHRIRFLGLDIKGVIGVKELPGVERSNSQYLEAFSQAKRWSAILNAAITQGASPAATVGEMVSSSANSSSKAERLIKLAALVEKGLLTEEDFKKLKDEVQDSPS